MDYFFCEPLNHMKCFIAWYAGMTSLSALIGNVKSVHWHRRLETYKAVNKINENCFSKFLRFSFYSCFYIFFNFSDLKLLSYFDEI